MPFVRISAGKFLMGSKDDNELALEYERPQHTLELPEFYMARFPVTNADYARFPEANFKVPKGKGRHPVVKVSWRDAMKYVEWLKERVSNDLLSGFDFTLPTEAQWEKAARGEYGNECPWGDEFDQNRCNSNEGGKGGTTPVDAYLTGVSPFGVLDMVGNVWEWTRTLREFEYPYKATDGREEEDETGRRVIRGGSFDYDSRGARCAVRDYGSPVGRAAFVGFRVCVSPIS